MAGADRMGRGAWGTLFQRGTAIDRSIESMHGPARPLAGMTRRDLEPSGDSGVGRGEPHEPERRNMNLRRAWTFFPDPPISAPPSTLAIRLMAGGVFFW